MKKRVAILGGSFDPIHQGHIQMANAALASLDADEVWFIPAKTSPLKDRVLLPAKNRLDMVRLVVQSNPRFKINTVDLQRNGISYSIDTMEILHENFPDIHFFWLIGTDQAARFHQWKNHERLRELAEFVVIDRKTDENTENEKKDDFRHIYMDPVDVSSTEIREGKKLNYLPGPVLQYILDHELYLMFWIKRPLTPHRMAHSASVARLCRELAAAHGFDEHKAWLAGLFHDIAKDLPVSEQKKWVEIVAPMGLKEHHAIWHGYAGSEIVDRIYGIKDPVIKNAIYNHVKGTSYDPYAMMVFIADKLDPLRGYDSTGLYNACLHDLYNGFMLVKRQNKEFLEKQKPSGQRKQAQSAAEEQLPSMLPALANTEELAELAKNDSIIVVSLENWLSSLHTDLEDTIREDAAESCMEKAADNSTAAFTAKEEAGQEETEKETEEKKKESRLEL